MTMGVLLCFHSIDSVHVGCCYVTGGPAFRMYDGPAEMMPCSSPCLDPIRFFRSGESKKTEAVLRFKQRRSFHIPKDDALAFSLHHFSTILLSSSPLAPWAQIRNSL